MYDLQEIPVVCYLVVVLHIVQIAVFSNLGVLADTRYPPGSVNTGIR